MTEGTGATPSLEGSRVLARYMRERGFAFEYLEVDGNHGSMVPMVWPRIFEFFNRQGQAPAPPQATQEIRLWSGKAPGSERWTIPEATTTSSTGDRTITQNAAAWRIISAASASSDFPPAVASPSGRRWPSARTARRTSSSRSTGRRCRTSTCLRTRRRSLSPSVHHISTSPTAAWRCSLRGRPQASPQRFISTIRSAAASECRSAGCRLIRGPTGCSSG